MSHTPCETVRVMTNKNNANTQLELGINPSGCTSPHRPSSSQRRPLTRTERAAWWFRRMHQVVDQATHRDSNLQSAHV